MPLVELIQRPWQIFLSSLEVLRQDIPVGAKIDAMVSRAVHGLSQPPESSYESTALPESAPSPESPPEHRELAEGLILSGGGAYAAYEVGVVKALTQGKSSATKFLPWAPDVISGTSAGSLNASLLLSASSDGQAAVEYLERVWMKEIADAAGKCGSGVFRVRDNPLTYINRNCYRDPAAPLSQLVGDNAYLAQQFLERGIQFLNSTVDLEQRALEAVDLGLLICTDPLKDLLQRNVRLDRIRGSPKKLRIAATNWKTGKVKIFTNADMTDDLGRNIIQASSSIPGVFPRVELDNNPYVDGGLIMNTPLKPAIDAGAVRLHVVFMDPEISRIPLPRLPNTASDLFRSLVIGFSATLQQDLALAATVNRGVAVAGSHAGAAASSAAVLTHGSDGAPHRQLTIHLHYPTKTLEGGWLSFSQDVIRKNMRQGYEDTVAHDCSANNCLVPA